MKVQYDHLLKSSFFLWFDQQLMSRADAYSTGIQAEFTYVDDPFLETNKIAYYAPYRQFKWNSDEAPEWIPSGVYVNGNFVAEGTSGLMIDFDKGRAIFDDSVGSGISVSGNFAIKDFNIYTTNQDEEDLVVNSNFISFNDNETYLESITGQAQNSFVVPAAFVNITSSQNKPFAIGGLDETEATVKVVVIAENDYFLDGILSLFRDTAREKITILNDFDSFPFAQHWSRKNGAFNYTSLFYSQAGNTAYIKDVETYKMRDSVSREITSDKKIGFIEFSLSDIRYPRTNRICNSADIMTISANASLLIDEKLAN